jgi:hypothetical protein
MAEEPTNDDSEEVPAPPSLPLPSEGGRYERLPDGTLRKLPEED